MKTFQFLIVLSTSASVYSISRGPGKRGIEDDGVGKYIQYTSPYSQQGSLTALSGLKTSLSYLNSPPMDVQYNSGKYLGDFNLGSQNVFSQLTSYELGPEDASAQNLDASQSQGYYSPALDANSLATGFKSGRFSSNGYSNTAGLGTYGQLPAVTNIKFSQPVQSYSPFQTRYTSSPVRVSYPRAVTASSYTPEYPPYQPVSSGVSAQAPLTIGSGSLGVTRLSNGNFALGSGSIGYGGGAPLVGYRPQIQHQIPVFQ